MTTTTAEQKKRLAELERESDELYQLWTERELTGPEKSRWWIVRSERAFLRENRKEQQQ